MAMTARTDAHAGTAGATSAAPWSGTVLWVSGGFYDVQTAHGIVRCVLRERLRKNLVYPESRGRRKRVQAVRKQEIVEPAVAGDRVRIAPPTAAQSGTEPIGTIEEILPRTREFTRQAVMGHDRGGHTAGQTIIANLDQLIVVISVRQPEPRVGLIDRFLAAAEAAELAALVCVNKLDLDLDPALDAELRVFEGIGYPVVRTSATSGQGIDVLREQLRDHVSAFVGASGVGKSTLLNALQPELALRVGAVSEATGKGKHTTRHARLIPLETGGFVADTPGLRQLSLWEVSPEEVEWCFREFRPLLGTCKFANCAHTGEVGCAIAAGVESGAVDRRRLESYRRLYAGQSEQLPY